MEVDQLDVTVPDAWPRLISTTNGFFIVKILVANQVFDELVEIIELGLEF